MAALFVYLDESESKAEKEPAACVAGYLATGFQWFRFAKEWNAVLEREGVEIFHASEFETEQGRRGTVYEHWSKAKRDSFHNELISIIQRNTLTEIGAGMHLSTYEKVMTPQRIRDFGSIYSVCALNTMINAAVWSVYAKFPYVPSFIFEKGGGYEHEAKRAHNILSNAPGFEEYFSESTITFQPKSKAFPQLQAADHLAFNLGKRISHLIDYTLPKGTKTEDYHGKEIRKLRYPLAQLFTNRMVWGQNPYIEAHKEKGLELFLSGLEGKRKIELPP